MTELFKHSGVLHYSGAYRLVVDVDPELSRYYRSLLPKSWPCATQRYATHITVVRPERDVPPNLAAWGKYEGENVEFHYEPGVRQGKVFYWLRVCSTRLEDIRLELGLPCQVSFDPSEASYTTPPAPFRKYFHITLGNYR